MTCGNEFVEGDIELQKPITLSGLCFFCFSKLKIFLERRIAAKAADHFVSS